MNPKRIKSSRYHPDAGNWADDYRRGYTQPRKRAALRYHRTGVHRKNVFVK